MTKYYSKSEIGARLLWVFFSPLFYFSPRLIYSCRNGLLRLFGAKIGRNVKIYPSAKITYPWLLEIGDNTVVSWNVTIYNLGKIKIGNSCVISQNAHLCGGTHDYNDTNFTLIRCGLTIGDNVWIASDAFIGPNVTVGNRCIVAARSVVVKNIEDNKIVGGNPSRIIKNRT